MWRGPGKDGMTAEPDRVAVEPDGPDPGEPGPAVRASRWGAWRPRIAVAAAGLLIGLSVAVTAGMLVAHRQVVARSAEHNEIVEAARASVTALLSIDYSRAKADVQRVLELSTGTFREDFAGSADDFVKTAEEYKALTRGQIKAAALESAQADGGVVLLAVNSEVTNSSGARDDSRPFRMSVTMTRDGDQFKMSGLEFVP